MAKVTMNMSQDPCVNVSEGGLLFTKSDYTLGPLTSQQYGDIYDWNGTKYTSGLKYLDASVYEDTQDLDDTHPEPSYGYKVGVLFEKVDEDIALEGELQFEVPKAIVGDIGTSSSDYNVPTVGAVKSYVSACFEYDEGTQTLNIWTE